jgi:hypothetical protein
LRRLVPAAVLLAACSFEPADLTSDPGAADARIDGPPTVIDASLPDAAPDQCADPSVTVSLASSVEGEVSGISRYANPSCPGDGDSGESIYRLDVSGSSGHDLVVDVSEPPSGNDSQIDVSIDCTPAGSVLPTCVDIAPRGHGDVVVIPTVENRRYYLVVEAFGTAAGDFTLNPFLRPVVLIGQPCAVDLRGARCGTGACLTAPDTKVASCRAIPPVAEDDFADNSRCATPHEASDDFVLSASIGSAIDVDFVQLTPATPRRIRAVVHGPDGGCPVDAELRLYSGNSCGVATEVLRDDDSGLGPCPVLVSETVLDPDTTHFLRVALDDGAPLPADGADYTLVVDFIDE